MKLADIKKMLAECDFDDDIPCAHLSDPEFGFLHKAPKIISQLLRQNEVMREAMEFYANGEHIDYYEDSPDSTFNDTSERGNFAKEALAECEKLEGDE